MMTLREELESIGAAMDPPVTLARATIFREIARERDRQERLKREGKFHWTCADPISPECRVTDAGKLAVLSEEVGEVARHVVEGIIDEARMNPRELKKELIEVAAVCVAWCESLL